MKPNLPHGPSFRLIDNVQEVTSEPDSAKSLYTYTSEEEWGAKHHFLGKPIMPAVMILEAMAQNAIQVCSVKPGLEKKLFVVRGIQNAEFFHGVTPDTELTLWATIKWTRNLVAGIAICSAYSGDKQIAKADIEFVVKNNHYKG